MNISVIGTGYVGLITGTCLADLGLSVICVDNDKEKISSLRDFQIPIYEPGLEDMIKRNFVDKRLTFTTSIKEAVKRSDAIFISVGTPSLNDGNADLSNVFETAEGIAENMDCYKLIIIKSTVPIGTCRQVKDTIQRRLNKRKKTIEFDIASNPEFLREGSAVHDFNHPDRIVFGVENERAARLMKGIYGADLFSKVKFVETTIETSEMIKYASNAFLATKISFINEIANICELCGADVQMVAKAMGLDKRIGGQFIRPGPGFGGSCFPKDVKAIIKLSDDLGYKPHIINSVLKTNKLQIKHSVELIEEAASAVSGGSEDMKSNEDGRLSLSTKSSGLSGKTFTVLGVAFKAETDDVRESPAIYIIEELLKHGGNVRVYDPKAMDNMKTYKKELNVLYCDSAYSACKNSDCIIIATEWKQFRKLRLDKLIKIVNNPVIVDLRNILDPAVVRNSGFIYKGIGRQ